MKNLIKRFAESILGKKFRVKVEVPHYSNSYFRVYYSNSFGIFYKPIGTWKGDEVLIPINDPEEVIRYGSQFKTYNDILKYEKEMEEELIKRGKFRSKRLV